MAEDFIVTALLQAAGVAYFLWHFGANLERAARPIGALAVYTAALGVVFMIGHAVVEPAVLAGEMRRILDPTLQGILLASDSVEAVAVRVFGLSMVAGGCLKPSRLGAAVALIGAMLIVVSFRSWGNQQQTIGVGCWRLFFRCT